MWESIENKFSRKSAGRLVVEAFLRHGLSIKSDGTIWCSDIEMAPAKIGRALGIDRRVVIATAEQIASDGNLLEIFAKLQPRAYVGEAAPRLGFDTIVIDADAHATGVVAEVTRTLHDNKVGIRQIIADDPDLFPEPKLSIVINGKLPLKALQALRKLPSTGKITIH